MKNKSGQAAIVIVVVTMMTVLGVAVATSTQSRVNLRDTVYSTQAEQAIACAEAGVDRALVDSSVASDAALTNTITLTAAEGTTGFNVSGCDGYTTTISNYPNSSNPDLLIPKIAENEVQQLRVTTGGWPSDQITINFRALEDNRDSALAVYLYFGNDQVRRSMHYCNTSGAGSAPANFISYNLSGEYCSFNIARPSTAVYLRIRSLMTDNQITIPNYRGQTGYLIQSTGTAGPVQRHINVYRYYSQLPGAFDEAIVSFGDGSDIDNEIN